MDWVPTVFLTFKFLVLGTGMFFAIKWHYDQGRKNQGKPPRALLRAAGTVAALSLLSLLTLGLAAFALVRMLGLDVSLP